MSFISNSSKIAIAFIRPFRSYLDGRFCFKNNRKEIEEEIRDKMDSIVEAAKEIRPDISEEKLQKAKDYMVDVSFRFLDTNNISYEKIMPQFLDSLTVNIEKEINSSFTKEEIDELTNLLSNKTFQKLINNNKLFFYLKSCETEMEHKMRMSIYDDMKEMMPEYNMDIFDDKKSGYNYEDDIDPESDNNDLYGNDDNEK